MNVYFTGSLFLGREVIAKKRGYESISDMYNDILNIWNSKISDKDHVYHLGNFAWDPNIAKIAMNDLNGTLIFIPGKYDKAIHDTYPDRVCSPIHVVNDVKFVLSHYPLADWDNKGEYKNLYSYKEHESDPDIDDRINCSWDIWRTPVDIELLNDFLK